MILVFMALSCHCNFHNEIMLTCILFKFYNLQIGPIHFHLANASLSPRFLFLYIFNFVLYFILLYCSFVEKGRLCVVIIIMPQMLLNELKGVSNAISCILTFLHR